MRRIVVNMLIMLLSVSLLIIVGEFSLRVYQFVKYGRPIFFSLKGNRQVAYIDKKLGWRITENYYREATKIDAMGEKYHTIITTNIHGFKLFGNTKANKKVFIVGDSFTQAQDVSNSKAYYGILASQVKNIDFFVYGGGGYGSLQEFMIIDEFIDDIKPQILILQLCSNDFINNDYLLELDSYENNIGMIRPYMDLKGNIFYKDPSHLHLPESLLSYSRLSSFVQNRVEIILSRISKRKTIEREIEREGGSHNGFTRSSEITKKIFDKIKERTSGVTIFVFCVDDGQPYYDEFRKIAILEGFEFIDGIPQAIRAYEKNGCVVRAADKSHWNELGHKIAAEKIYEFLFKKGVISNQK